jgi:hypothetical protein
MVVLVHRGLKQLNRYCTIGLNWERTSMVLKPSFAEIWKRILACEGEEFKTTSNLPFSYEVTGNFLCPSRTDFNISKADFAKAYELVPINGPGVITKLVRGPAYIFAILHDERISKNEW